MTHAEPSNAELSKQISEFKTAIQPVIDVAPKLIVIVDAYDSVMFGKKFVVGLASILGAIAVVGGAVLYIVNWIRHG